MTALRLTIDNHSALPDGGPLTYTLTGRRGMDIGRDPHLDWVLPDPTRIVSGKHCEIRFRDGGYWLHDVSSNGTYLNGETARLPAPRRLRTGDRLEIGPYLISITVDGAADSQGDPAPAFAPSPPAAVAPADLWGIAEEVAPPARVDRARAARPLHNYDFIDSASDIPGVLITAHRTSRPACDCSGLGHASAGRRPRCPSRRRDLRRVPFPLLNRQRHQHRRSCRCLWQI